MRKKIKILSLIFSIIISVTLLLPGCASSESHGATTPAVSSSQPPAPATTPAATEFGRLLGLVPGSFLQERDIWFGNPGQAWALHGIDNRGVDSLRSLPPEKTAEVLAAMVGINLKMRFSSAGEVATLTGIDRLMVDRTIFSEMLPPWSFSIDEGEFDGELIQSKLIEQGYARMEYGPYSYYSIRGDNQMDLRSELGRLVLAELNRVAVLDNTIVTASTTDAITGVLDRMSGEGLSVMDTAAGRALADSLGEVLGGVIMNPAQVLTPGDSSQEVDPFYFDIPADWGILHPYEMVGMGYRHDGEESSWVISLFYQDAQTASADGDTLLRRMQSYVFFTQNPQTQQIPDKRTLAYYGFSIGEPVVKDYPEGATLTVECRGKPWLINQIQMGDLLFLAPDPAPYTAVPQPAVSQAPLSLAEAEKQFKETGSTLADTVENASKLAGYPVATPSYLPEGFVPRDNNDRGGIFAVYQPTGPASNAPVEVALVYAQSSDFRAPRGPRIIFIQSNNQGDVLMNNPTEIDINGHPGKRSILPGSVGNPDMLVLSWRDGKVMFMLQGTLQDPLDEAVLLRVAESVGVH